jgi:hypothetical protein
MLMTFAPLTNSSAADLQPPESSEFKSPNIKSIDEPARASLAAEDTLAQVSATTDKDVHANPEDKVFQVPLPSAIWLMAGGLLALVLIRRRHK